MSQLSRVRKGPAIATVTGACVLTFAGLAFAIGGDERTVAEPRAVSVSVPTETVAPPPAVKPRSAPEQRAQAEQGDRRAEDRSTDGQGSPAGAAAGGGLSLERAVGRMIMTGYAGGYPSSEILRRARAGEIGGVILMGENVGPQTRQAIGALQRAAVQGTGHRLVIATDQEGGTVRRFTTVAPYMAAGRMSPQAARVQGTATGKGLAAVGVNTDLAPVADVGHPGSFMGSRTFPGGSAQVAQAACQFAAGLNAGGVNATLKHFPGLGYALKNTDTATAIVRQSGSALAADLVPYRTCQPQLVMVSNATYPALDPSGPAVFSRRIVRGLLRDQLGYPGVVISDSLTATSVTSPTTAVRAAQAGVDMLLYIEPAVSALAYQKVLAAARDGRLRRSAVQASARRVGRLTR